MKFQFESLQAFMAMGNHGPYVWSVVIITLLVLTGLIAWPLKLHRDALREQQRLDRIHQARAQQANNQVVGR